MTTEKSFIPDPHAHLPESLKNMVMKSTEEDTIYGPDNFPVTRVDMESSEELIEEVTEEPTKLKSKKK